MARPKMPRVTPDKKQCSACKLFKPPSAFSPRPQLRDGLRSECRDCHNREVVKYGKKNPHKRKQWARACVLKRDFGITTADYKRMMAEQNGRCLICGIPSESLCVDHDHETKKVRGLLCRNCNLAVGNLRENRDIALALVRYLDERVLP